jgi:hypothetical protein
MRVPIALMQLLGWGLANTTWIYPIVEHRIINDN